MDAFGVFRAIHRKKPMRTHINIGRFFKTNFFCIKLKCPVLIGNRNVYESQ